MDDNWRQVLVALIGALGGFAGGVFVAKLGFDHAKALEADRRASERNLRWTRDLREVAARLLGASSRVELDATIGPGKSSGFKAALIDLETARDEVALLRPALAAAASALARSVQVLWAKASDPDADAAALRRDVVDARRAFVEACNRELEAS